MNWQIIASLFTLNFGVMLSQQSDNYWLGVLGYVILALTPLLISDGIRKRLNDERRRWDR